jgi:hypothetical protein
MADIGDFAERAAERVLEYQALAPERFKLGLNKSTVDDFIKMVFYASLIRDEGRFSSGFLITMLLLREQARHQAISCVAHTI